MVKHRHLDGRYVIRSLEKSSECTERIFNINNILNERRSIHKLYTNHNLYRFSMIKLVWENKLFRKKSTKSDYYKLKKAEMIKNYKETCRGFICQELFEINYDGCLKS